MIGRGRLLDLDRWVHRDSLQRCSLRARLLFGYLPAITDDYGRCLGAPDYLLGQFFYNEDSPEFIETADVIAWLTELKTAGEISHYVNKGTVYLQIVNWHELARPDRHSGRQYPAPPERPEPTHQPDLFVDRGARARLRVIPK